MLKNRLILWVESYLNNPNLFQKIISFSLLPITFIYWLFIKARRIFIKAKKYDLHVISVGNLNVGGSGKTPFILSLAKHFEKPAIILRGYKRKSKGLHIISHFGQIKTNLDASGDEAMLYAKSLKNALVIVSEDRVKAIKEAKKLGSKVAFLDDGFNKINIKKFDILLRPNPYPKNTFCLPSGGFREPQNHEKYADLVVNEGKDFKRKIWISNKSEKMVLVTAIANAKRLDKYLPKEVIKKYIFPDHHPFNKKELEKILYENKATSILTTRKDWVKMEDFNLPLSFLELEILLDAKIVNATKNYIDDQC
ncbi:MAG: tetraacyldisaccharide 4'-kinase [Proteobacteria bacterium]|nr:MAG: tetraacyldisaccharide 4'-kinase [Pseudomonadota bacterium]